VAEIKATSVFSTTIRTDALQTELDRHGAQGWELVSVLPQSHPVGMPLSFKRPG
jgi:hypothetical protein